MKKYFSLILLLFVLWSYSQYALPAVSPRQKVTQQFSLSEVSLDYGRPSVKGRKIFGDLVPYGKIWRAGANSATKITFEQPMVFGSKTVPPGEYALFVIPQEKEWKILLNRNAAQWGAFAYDDKLNVADVTVPVKKTADVQEVFEIDLVPKNDTALDLVFRWDQVETIVPLKVANAPTVSKIAEKLAEIKQIEKDSLK